MIDKRTPPAFRFYVDNFVEGTVHYTDSETGLYIRMLCAQWSQGGLPNDDMELIRFSRGSTTAQQDLSRVKKKFRVCDDGLLRNDRLEIERKKQAKFSKSQSDKGKASAKARQPGLNRGSTGEQPSVSVSVTASREELQPKGQPADGKHSKAPIQAAQEVFDAWNAADGLPKCLVISDKRRRMLHVRLSDLFFVANWRAAVQKVAKSDFCRGQSERGWRATFDWFISPDAVTKIIEGKYDNIPRNNEISRPNPRNEGIVRGPTNYATATTRFDRERAAKKAAMAGQVAAPADNPPPAIQS